MKIRLVLNYKYLHFCLNNIYVKTFTRWTLARILTNNLNFVELYTPPILINNNLNQTTSYQTLKFRVTYCI